MIISSSDYSIRHSRDYNIPERNWYKIYVVAFRNRLEMLSKRICEIIFNSIKIDISKSFFLKIMPKDEEELSVFGVSEVDCNIHIENLSENTYLVGGEFDPETYIVTINVKIDPKFSTENYDVFLGDLLTAIRHELQHPDFQNVDPHHMPEYIVEEPGDNLDFHKRVSLRKQYLEDLSEREAIIRQIMMEAKYRKEKFVNLLHNFLWFELVGRVDKRGTYAKTLGLADQGVKWAIDLLEYYKNLKNSYMQRSLEIYPNIKSQLKDMLI